MLCYNYNAKVMMTKIRNKRVRNVSVRNKEQICINLFDL